MRISRGVCASLARPAAASTPKVPANRFFALAGRPPRRQQRVVPPDPLTLRALRWSARLLGAALVGLLLLIAAGEGLPRPDQLGTREWTLFAALAAIAGGHLGLWVRDGVGATFGLAGYALFLGVEGTPLSPRLAYIHLLALPSVLALAAAFWSRLRRSAASGPARPPAAAPGSPACKPRGKARDPGPAGSGPSPK